MLQILIILIICLITYIIIDNNIIRINRQKVNLTRTKHDKIKVLQISDLHNRKFCGRLAKKINSENADVICFTGDMENDISLIKNKNSFINFIESLSKDVLMLYVDGNNGKKTMDINTLELTSYGKVLERFGVKILKDFYILENEKICFVNTDVCRYITNLNHKKGRKKLKRPDKIDFSKENNTIYRENFIKKLNEYKEKYTIIGVGHYPFNLEQMYNVYKNKYNSLSFDLNLAGHYHGGQFNLPLFGVIFVPSMNSKNECYFPKKNEIQHLQTVGSVYQNISKGLGSTNADIIIPILAFRLFNTPEIDIIEVD